MASKSGVWEVPEALGLFIPMSFFKSRRPGLSRLHRIPAPNGPPFALVVMFFQIWTWGVLTSDSPFSLPGKRSRSIWWGSGGRWVLEPIDS